MSFPAARRYITQVGRQPFDRVVAEWVRQRAGIEALDLTAAAPPTGQHCRWWPLPHPRAAGAPPLVDGHLTLADLVLEAAQCMADADPHDPEGGAMTPLEFCEWLGYRVLPTAESVPVRYDHRENREAGHRGRLRALPVAG